MIKKKKIRIINKYKIHHFVIISLILLSFSIINNKQIIEFNNIFTQNSYLIHTNSNLESTSNLDPNKSLNAKNKSSNKIKSASGSDLHPTALDFINISFSFPDIVYIQGVLNISILVNKEVTIYFLIEIISYLHGEGNLLNYQRSDTYTITKGYHYLFIPITLDLYTISGEYSIHIFTFLYNTSSQVYQTTIYEDSEYFEVIVGPLFFLLFTISFLLFSLYFSLQNEYLIKRPRVPGFLEKHFFRINRLRKIKTKLSNISMKNIISKENYNYILCPDCEKAIVEESAFCPYCGYHLKLYERHLYY